MGILTNHMQQYVKIIGGKFKGKKIHFPNMDGLRPTPNRVRETLFNWLMNIIRGTRCLDAFAGSGALGIEACSRGASQIILLETATRTYEQLQQTCMSLKTNNIQLIHIDAETYLFKQPEPFDIIFLDPPFIQNNYINILKLIHEHNLLKPHGLIYIEAPQNLNLDPYLWQIQKIHHLPNLTYALYKHIKIY